jgi:hypothetical protein
MTEHLTIGLTSACRVRPTPAAATAPALTTFAELICADSDLLQLEFDAIIAANFPPGTGQPTARPPIKPATVSTRRAEPSRSTRSPRVGRPRHRAQPTYPRERSPPNATTAHRRHHARR